MDKKSNSLYSDLKETFQDLLIESEDFLYLSDLLVCDEITDDLSSESV